MRLSRTDLIPVLAIVAGGVIGASLSFSFLGSRSDDVPALDPWSSRYESVELRSSSEVNVPTQVTIDSDVTIRPKIVQYWIINESGVAASQITFSRRTEDGTQDFYVIDSDGENLRRLTVPEPVANSYESIERVEVLWLEQGDTIARAWALPAGRRRIEVDSDGSVLRSYRLAGVESGSQ